MKTLFLYSSLLIHALFNVAYAEEEWSFLVLADFHGAEAFALNPGQGTEVYDRALNQFKYINENFGGEVLIIPGDTQGGKWFTDEFIQRLNPELHGNPHAAVLQAGDNCYKTITQMLTEAGYARVLMAVGDHELGDNLWKDGATKTQVVPQFRQALANAFNKDSEGDFLFPDSIGAVDSRPLGTIFEDTSFAYQYKNVLFITVDAFHSVETGKDFYDPSMGIGGEGVITCTVEGRHLEWFTNVLRAAQNESTIKHIIVQAHIPILQPVQMVDSSGAFFDYGEESLFWQTMVDYGVDIYFGGEVHANTATKDSKSNLIQVVTRGNLVNNFLKVEVTDDGLRLLSFNEVGPLPRYNRKHVLQGNLTVDKVNSEIYSSGVLKLLNREVPLIHFDFEEIVSLKSRQVLGMKHDNKKKTLVAEKITIRGIECEDALPNKGSFAQNYDGQIANVNLKTGINGLSGAFDSSSRFGIYSSGPHGGGGHAISYSLWFKTNKSSEMILIHYSALWDSISGKKDMFTLTLQNGNPILYTRFDTKLEVKEKSYNLNDNQWHHLAVTMPRNHCLISEVEFFIDGKKPSERIIEPYGNDHHIFFINGGKIGIGGVGYSDEGYDDKFKTQPYVGEMDDIFVWGRPITKKDIRFVMKGKAFKISPKRRCEKTSILIVFNGNRAKNCKIKCMNRPGCWGYEYGNSDTDLLQCTLFRDRPIAQEVVTNKSRCVSVI